MRTHLVRLALIIVTAAGLPAAVLVSGGLRAEVEPERGRLVSLTSAGRELLAAPSPAFLLRLTDPADRTSQWLDPGHAEQVTLRADDQQIVATARFGARRLTAVTTWRAVDDGIEATTAVTNDSGAILESVTAPMLRLRPAVHGDADGTRLFVPGGDGYLVGRDGWRAKPWNGRGYPGHASMQYLALFGQDGGLTLQTRDPQALPKAFEAPYDAEHEWIELRVSHALPFVAGQSFTTPPTRLVPCGSTWQSAAAMYRTWARQQPWARPKRGADAPPAWLDGGFITLGGQLRPLGLGRLAVQPEQWPDVVRRLRAATGAPSVLLDLREWEHDGIYTSPFYFPLYPSDDGLKALLAGARAESAHATAMVAGLQWMIEREPYQTRTYQVTGFDGRARFERDGRAVCVVGRDGQVQIDAPFFNWDGRKAKMCPAHAFTQAHFPDAARRLAGAGFDLFEFDQMNGGGCPPCYATTHGHPQGPGAWMSAAVTRFVAAARAAGREVRSDFGTSLEDPSEVLLPVLDSYVSRADNITEWPANGAASEVVPAFAFVYGPLARPLCIDVQHSVTPDAYQLLLTARAFAGGCLPSTNLGLFGILYKHGEDDLLPTPDKLDPAQLRLLAAVTRARCGPLREFVSQGEAVAVEPPPLAPAEFAFSVWEDGHSVAKKLMHPPVLASGWTLPDGRTALAFVNVTETEQRFAYPRAGGEVRVPALDVTVVHSP
ncbi:MAG: hypothetical protein HZB16_24295 [Armatimonadetes bacterium]|nr:hypothetical protein [Armatimonadota bacterium]